MRIGITLGIAALGVGVLAGCNDGSAGASVDAPGTEGSLLYSPPFRVASISAADLTAQISAMPGGAQLLALAGTPKCGVDVHMIVYSTVGGAGETTRASGALMAPTGGAGCSGARPILEYAHGTAYQSNFNIADITNTTTNPAYSDPTGVAEGPLIVAFFAAQGYIVVAPNYVGYDTQDVATLPYHPYLNAAQQSQEMIDALTAARSAISAGLPSGVSDNGKLFLTGYSQGGHVAMATHRAMQAKGMTVTASAPMSGPYAMLSFGDAVVTYSSVGIGGTVYYPMVINSYQHSYHNLYQATSDIFSSTYATGIDTLLPGLVPPSTLFQQGKLPEFALFNSTTPGQGSEPSTGIPALNAAMAVPSNPLNALGFGNPYLIKNSERVSYALDSVASPDGTVPAATTLLPPAATPSHPLRADLKLNDLRGWSPNSYVMLCGGKNDPEVFYPINTQIMGTLWSAQVATGQVTVVDVDPTSQGAVFAQIGGIVATAFGTDRALGVTSVAQIAGDVQTAVVTNAAFSAYFTSGVPNSPQGVWIATIAGVAAQAVATFMAQGVTDPATMGADVGNAVVAYYHYPSTQIACEVAAQAFFKNF
jgi:hypothetical protein